MKKIKTRNQGLSGSQSTPVSVGEEPVPAEQVLPVNQKRSRGKALIPSYAVLVCVISFFVYGFNYSYSPGLFWDENYHITSAQKYIDGVFFMGDHPPLGKELIAVGELLLQPNKKIDTSSFLSTEKAEEVPEGYAFTGMRFMPAFLAVLSGVVFFFLLLALLGNPHLALLFSGCYLFENAFVVHSRGAMLDSIQLFFVLTGILCTVRMIVDKEQGIGRYLVLGMLIGASTAVKLNALLFLCLPLALFMLQFWQNNRSLRFYLRSALAGSAGFMLVFLGSYVIHIYLTPHVQKDRYYEASAQYREILDKGETRQLRHLALQIREQLEFIPKYQKGVPEYDPSKPDENGSLPYTWPIMNKTISYRWEKNVEGKVRVRYLYLVGNPLLWGLGLLAVILSTGLVLSRCFVKTAVRNEGTLQMILLFTALYWFYMAAMLQLKRVMYLYHYFIPLISSYVLAALLFSYFFEEKISRGDRRPYLFAAAGLVLAFAVFLFFSPLSYYQPLSYEEFQLRNWFPWWKMEVTL